MQKHVFVPLSILCSTLAAAGCGPGAAGEAVRPKDPTAASALGEAGDCTSVSSTPRPFLADWKADQRAQIDVAMQKGVAVVAYGCDGIKLLSDCSLKGQYAFAKIERQRETLELNSNDDLAATIPLSAASVSTELKRGLALQLAYVMVGQKGTTLLEAQRTDLVGKCDGATHFVRAAWIGAFKFGTATEGSVSSNASVLGAEAGASSASAKKMQNEAGNPEACDKAGSDGPPEGCGAMVRLELAPIVAKAGAEAVEVAVEGGEAKAAAERVDNPCSTGYVLDKGGKCTKKSSASAYLCDGKDVAECVTQCEKGSAESCLLAGNAQMRKDVNADFKAAAEASKKYYEKGCTAGNAASCGALASRLSFGAGADKPRAKQLYKKACDGGDRNACGALGVALESGSLEEDRAGYQPDLLEAVLYIRKACNLGSGMYCSQLAKRYIEGKGVAKNPAEGVKALEKSCETGDSFNCFELAKLYRRGEVTRKDPKKAEQIFTRLCDKKNSGACAELGEMYREGDGVAKSLDKAKATFKKGCPDSFGTLACVRLGEMTERGEGGAKDDLEALALYERACPPDKPGWYPGCYAAGSLLEKGGASVKRDVAKAAGFYERACRFTPPGADTPEDKAACKKAGTLLMQQDKTKAKELYRKVCMWHKDAQDCAIYKRLGGTTSTPPPPPGPPKSASKT